MLSKLLSYRPPMQLFLIALVGCIAYSNSFQVPFFLDDEGSIINNGVIKNLDQFLSGSGYAYNPRRFLGYLSVALNYHFGALNVTGYHAVNLAIHIKSAWLVYALAYLTLQTPFFTEDDARTDALPGATSAFLPLAAALLFVAHPVQTQAVTYIIQRLASLATLFYVLSLCCYAKARLVQETSGKSLGVKQALFYVLALTAAGCAMKTKEIAFTLPFMVVLYEFFFFRMTALKKVLFLAPIALTVLVVPLSILGTGRPLGQLLSDISTLTRVQTEISRLDYLFTQFPVIATYIRLIFLPVNQNLDYDFPIYSSLASAPVLLSFLLILALLTLALYLVRRSLRGDRRLRLISFGILWFFIALSVESSLIPIVDVIYEHRVYLPSVGAFIALSALASLLMQRFRPRAAALALGVVIVALSGATFARNQVWGSALTFWSDVVRKSPDKARPHYNLALALDKERRADEALKHALEAARLEPAEAYAFNLIGNLMGRAGNYQQAAAALGEAIRLDPQMVGAHVNLGDVYRINGLTQEALEQYEIALKLTPTDADIYHKIGTAHATKKDLDKAVVFFQCAVSINPGRPEYRMDLQRAQGLLRNR